MNKISRMFLITLLSATIVAPGCKTKRHLTGNPYIDAKERQSTKERKADQKLVERGTKNWKRLKKDNKKKILANNEKFFSKGAQYEPITKANSRQNRKNRRKRNWVF